MRNKRTILWLALLWSVLTATATEPVRPLCSSGRHQRKAVVAYSNTKSGSRRVSPFSGQKRQLVILAEFNDKKYQVEEPLTLWNDIFNQGKKLSKPFVGSVHDYFFDQSYGQFDLLFDMFYVPLDKPQATYRSIGTDDSNSGILLSDVIEVVKQEITDWSVYDWNGDDYVDQVLMLFPGKGQSDGGGSNTIWPHQWSLTGMGHEPITVGDEKHHYYVDSYGVFPELSGSGDYGSFGTLCHEFGHCLGLPDFYYSSSSKVVGAWDIMDYGNYNQKGFCPPGYSAHERMLLGWLDFRELTEPATIKDMKPLSEAAEAFVIRNSAYDNEYYVVENRQKTGWDSSLPSQGVVIFHIDYDEEVWRVGLPNTSSLKRYTIIPANNNTFYGYQSGWPYPYLENDSLTNNSEPAATLLHNNADGELLMSKPLTHIKVADGLATFDFMGGEVSGIRDVSDNDSRNSRLQNSYVYDMSGRIVGNDIRQLGHGVYIIRRSDGTLCKVMKK